MELIIRTKLPTLDEWCAALRELDGQDAQATGCLMDVRGRMCCLGVLTHEAGPRVAVFEDIYEYDEAWDDHARSVTWQPGWVKPGHEHEYDNLPPKALMEEYGMTSAGWPLRFQNMSWRAVHATHPEWCPLSEMNDNGASFTRIAEQIEEWRDEGLIHDPRTDNTVNEETG